MTKKGNGFSELGVIRGLGLRGLKVMIAKQHWK